MKKPMHLEFKDLNQLSLCPVGWPLGRVRVPAGRTLASNHPRKLFQLSSQQLKCAAQIKERIEQLEARLMRLLHSEGAVAKVKIKHKHSKRARRTVRRQR